MEVWFAGKIIELGDFSSHVLSRFRFKSCQDTGEVITAGSPFSAEALLAIPFLFMATAPEPVEAATKVSLRLEANCQIVD